MDHDYCGVQWMHSQTANLAHIDRDVIIIHETLGDIKYSKSIVVALI